MLYTPIAAKGLDIVYEASKCYLGHSRIPKRIFGPNISLFVVTRWLTVAQNQARSALKSQFLAIIAHRKYLFVARNDFNV